MAIILTQGVEKLKARDTREKNLSVELGFLTGITPILHIPNSKQRLEELKYSYSVLQMRKLRQNCVQILNRGHPWRAQVTWM